METPLTPLDFMRRARKLHGRREAVVDGDLRLTYEQFGDRCDRWSSALQRIGVRKAIASPTSRPTPTPSSNPSTRSRNLARSSSPSTTA